MPDGRHLNDEEIRGYVNAAGEGSNIDFKGPVTWDGKETSAGLTKDILAFANSPDGGVIVIGKSEDETGKFVVEGLTDDQAASFESTIVSQWVNARCSPPVDLTCCHAVVDGKRFVAIVVAEFRDVPIVCTKAYNDSKKTILQVGMYVRSSDAASAPISREDEIRKLVGLAVRKQGDTLAATLSAILGGRHVSTGGENARAAGEHVATLLQDVRTRISEIADEGAWTLSLVPMSPLRARWPDASSMLALLERVAVRISRPLPWVYLGKPTEWGIVGSDAAQAWGLTREGAFVCILPFRETSLTYTSPWTSLDGSQPRETRAPGTWLDLIASYTTVIEFFMLASRLAAEFDPEEELRITLEAAPIEGRVIACTQSQVSWDTTAPTAARAFRAPEFLASAAVVRAEWETRCAAAIHRFLELFSVHRLSDDTIASWIERYKSRGARS